MRVLLLLMLVGCGSYKRDVETICEAEDLIEGSAKVEFEAASPARKSTMLLDVAAPKVKTDEGRKLLTAMGVASPAGRVELIRTASAKVGLMACPIGDFLADVAQKQKSQPPAPSSQPAPSASSPDDFFAPPKKEKVFLKMGDTKVIGKLAPEPMARVVRANFPKFRACYEEALARDASLTGTITVTLTVTAKATVENVAVTGGTIKEAKLRKCIVDAYQSLAFPVPESGRATMISTIEYQPAFGAP